MRKSFSIVIVLLLFVAVSAASIAQVMPPEVKTFMLKFYREMTVARDKFVAAINAAETPAKIATAVNSYADAMEPLIDGMVELEAKHGEYFASVDRYSDDASSGDAEVDAAEAKFEADSEAFEDQAMMKVVQNYADAAVKSAMDRLETIMSRLDSEDYDDYDYEDYDD